MAFNLRRKKSKEIYIPKSVHEEKEYEEGIFHVKEIFHNNGGGDYWKTREKTVEGKVVDLTREQFHFNSSSSFHKGKDKAGIYLEIETPKGSDKIKFPREFSLLDGKAIKDQNIKYFYSKENYEESSGCGLETNIYKLDILSGPLEGEKLEEKVIA